MVEENIIREFRLKHTDKKLFSWGNISKWIDE